jgi:hypothetical protein
VKDGRQAMETPVMQSIFFVGGVFMFVLGFGIYLGNRTGLLPTFPFLGFATMGIGAILLTIGRGH